MFCSIIGYPLKKPRSPIIWNKFFKKNKIKSKMLALEINKKNFNREIKKIFSNKFFLASAITMPYKIEINKYANYLDQSSKLSKSTNLIIKKKNKFYAYNTDIYGFLNSVKRYLKIKDIIIFGLGGSGSAIYNYLSKKFNYKSFLIITKKIKKNKLNTKYLKKIKLNNIDIRKKYLIINCTPLGSNLKKEFENKSILNDDFLKKINKSSIVYDLVYKPKKTKLFYQCMKNKIKYINGIEMNTFQANKAIEITLNLTKFRI
tara:strand:- start:235 stop:1014 length:780 start_codon:yes stop_codon:yes gene_type:complete